LLDWTAYFMAKTYRNKNEAKFLSYLFLKKSAWVNASYVPHILKYIMILGTHLTVLLILICLRIQLQSVKNPHTKFVDPKSVPCCDNYFKRQNLSYTLSKVVLIVSINDFWRSLSIFFIFNQMLCKFDLIKNKKRVLLM